MQHSGSDSMSSAVTSKDPHDVGKSSESMPALTDWRAELLRGNDTSWISRKDDECGLGTRPRGEVRKGPISPSSSSGAKPREYQPAAYSDAMYDDMKRVSNKDDL